jgi:hypothetical protein
MRKTISALSFVAALCLSCLFFVPAAFGAQAAAAAKPPERAPAAADPNSKAAVPEVVVARFGEEKILRQDLEERLLRDLRPREEEYARATPPVTAEATLRTMLGEKAMSQEGRRLGYLKDETIGPGIEQFEQGQLAGMLVERELRDRVSVDSAEVDRVLKANPKATREQVTAMLQQASAAKLFESFYGTLTQKFHLKKAEDNFAQAAQIHQRLLEQPVEKRGTGEYWIKNSQVKNELTEKEKGLVLATYDGGQFTLHDWLLAVCNMAPPRRPADLSTAVGVGRLVERALRLPILVAEAKARGYDKDEKLRSDVKRLEDQQLLYKVQEVKMKETGEPTAEQVKAYFEKNQERFAKAATMKINQIWCPNLDVAKQVKAALDGGTDFETAKKTHSLQKEEPVHLVAAVGEGLFWPELWKGDPNQVLGPMKGFYGSGAKWRIVKILEKTPAQTQPYSEQVANSVKSALLDEQRRRALEEYQTELLKKCPHEIFSDRLKDIDALDVAMGREDK